MQLLYSSKTSTIIYLNFVTALHVLIFSKTFPFIITPKRWATDIMDTDIMHKFDFKELSSICLELSHIPVQCKSQHCRHDVNYKCGDFTSKCGRKCSMKGVSVARQRI